MIINDKLYIAGSHNSNEDMFSDDGDTQSEKGIQKINKQPRDEKFGRSRYALHFFKESEDELRMRKEEARREIKLLPLEKQEISDDYFPLGIDMPKRPPWNFSMTKEQLELREQNYFKVSFISQF